MTNRLYLTSLAIELDADYFEFDESFIYGPAKFNIPILRVFIHEVLHFWQTLSLGFITNLALHEWLQLLDYENKITYFRDQERKKMLNSFKKVHPKLGFSAYNLSEALCRFWDIHIMGPLIMVKIHHDKLGFNLSEVDKIFKQRIMTSQVYDMLMQVEDTYAEPYRFSLKKWGSKNSVIMFPTIAYFALQTPSPVEVFASTIDALNDIIMLDEIEENNIHKLWQIYFEKIHNTCNNSSIEVCGATLTPGWEIINRSELKNNPIYSHYSKLVEYLYPIWGHEINLFFALPGDPVFRKKMSSAFRPPVTILYNGRWTGRSGIAMIGELMGDLIDSENLADIAQEITQRYLKMFKARKFADIS